MRILIHAGNFFPEKTGIGKYTGEMAGWLSRQGHQVDVITGFPYYPEWCLDSRYRGTGFLIESWESVQIHRVPHYIPRDGKVNSLRRMLVDLTLFMASLPVWARLCFPRRRRPHVIITVCPPLISGVWPALLSCVTGTPWIYHVQDFQVDAAVRLGMIRQSLFGKALYALENLLIRSATRVSSITNAMCKLAVSKGAKAENVLCIPNWSDTHSIHPIDRLTPFRRELNVGEDQVLVMYAGAMGRKQGLSLVVDAAERLMRDPRFVFVMIGSGSDAQELRLEAQGRGLSNMRFLPLQELQRLNQVLGSADIHLVVQKADAADLVMPSKLTNILAAGRPAIVTAAEGTELWDVTAGQGTGLAVPPEDILAFVNALLTLAGDSALRAQLGSTARLYAEQNIEQDAVLGRLQHILMSLNKAEGLQPSGHSRS